ncbi:MAG: hypothetical protein FWB86_08315 [Treponema sp.]|nr:hypothetical protein [Treponema sp.]MCL2251802.1 hypothetical protein [Treponema sp.]
MKRKLILSLILIIIFVQNINSQQNFSLGDLYTETSFTMSMPAGWRTVDFNQKYLMIIGQEVGGLTPNIGFGDEAYAGTISDYINILIDSFPIYFTDFVLVNRSNITTNAGITGERITYQATMGQIRIRQIMYVLPNKQKTAVMCISCTAPINSGETLDAVFEASVKTFLWLK